MKISLVLGARQPLSRQTAWGCLTANLAMPGFGSLAAGIPSGYVQLALGLGGMALTLFGGVRFFFWYLANWSQLSSPEADPIASLRELWLAVRWPLLGIGLFLGALLWALFTSLRLLQAARRNERAAGPPPLP
jgi:hypothetical protein